MNHERLLTILLVGMLLSACTQFEHYRTAMPPTPMGVDCVVPSTPKEDRDNPALRDFPPCEEKGSDDPYTIQHRYYTTPFEPEALNYHLSFVEFDDQGWFAEREQMNALFTLLNDLKKQDKETLIYVYAHGWKHNAKACDNNIVCFSRLLERLDLTEKKLFNDDPETQRAVVGVYLGWRGLPFGSALNNLSFWSRKNAAARVGRGGVFELLTKLKDYRDDRLKDYRLKESCRSRLKDLSDDQLNSLLKENPGCASYVDPNTGKLVADSGKPTQLVITGHSFGGLVMYEALSHALMERAAKITMDADGKLNTAESFGDFVMLVNPAFEGSLYEPLFQIATHREYVEKQRPVMMIVTSDADSATKNAFPIGRTFSTLFEHAERPEQRDSMRIAVGHNERYVTHKLQDKKELSEEEEKEIKKREDKSDCGCRYLVPTSKWDEQNLNNLMALIGAFAATSNCINDYSGEFPSESESEGITLTNVPSKTTYPPNYPYLVVKTDEKLIPNHNAIYKDRFTTFTQAFILTHVIEGSPLPTTNSCPAP